MNTKHTYGLARMIQLGRQSSLKTLLAWTLSLIALALMTAGSLRASYPTAEKLKTYSESVGSGEAVAALNGRIAGLDTFGGVFANEFAFMANLAIPLLAITLMSRFTRQDEESGRAELLYAGPIGRYTPIAAALIITLSTLAVVSTGVFLSLISFGAEPAASFWYCLSLWALGSFFAGISAVFAQIFESSRAVLGASFAIVLLGLAVRAMGATSSPEHLAEWFSPFGWSDRVAPFGDLQVAPLALFVVAFACLTCLAIYLRSQRDAGGALFMSRPGKAHATPAMKNPLGLALLLRRGSMIGWAVGVGAFMLLYGALIDVIEKAIMSNPDMVEIYGADGANSVLDGVVAMFLMVFAMLVAGYGIAASGPMRNAENTGVLETQLAAPQSRRTWWLAQMAATTISAAIVGVVGAAALAGGMAATTGDSDRAWSTFTGAAWQLPAIVLFVALALAVTGIKRSWMPAVWSVFGVSAVLGLMGPMLKLPDNIVDYSPLLAVGKVPAESGNWTAAIIISGLALVAAALGFRTFTRRDIPSH